MDLKYSWEPIGKRIFHSNFVYELVRSNNTGETTLSSYVNSYYSMHNTLSFFYQILMPRAFNIYLLIPFVDIY